MKKRLFHVFIILVFLSSSYFFFKTYLVWECPSDMVYVPAGKFLMRWTGERYNGSTENSVYTNHYCIDIYEFPNIIGEYPRSANWTDAKKMCKEHKKKLCTEYEWQKACQGPNNYLYPYGNEFDEYKCNTHTNNTPRKPVPIGSFPECVSGYGVHDMSGSLSEWVFNTWHNDPNIKTIKGGSYNININNMQKWFNNTWVFVLYSNACDSIHHHTINNWIADDGFRCCKNPNIRIN